MNQTQQTQQSAQVSQEELAKTQVLNLTDVQEIADFEKKTSKRPAVLFAIAGFLAITLGFSYANIMNAIDAIPSKSTVEELPEIIYNDNILNNVRVNEMNCTFTSPYNANGTSGVAAYKFIFDENDQLQRYTMTLTFDPQIGNADGVVAVQNYYNQYKTLDVLELYGYQTVTTYTDTGMKTIISVDLTKLDKALLTPTHNSTMFSTVSDNLNDTKATILQKYSASNYLCQ